LNYRKREKKRGEYVKKVLKEKRKDVENLKKFKTMRKFD
jgi:xanthine dehydrogenase iron-sulfur cluster and FAD-binding subunit A